MLYLTENREMLIRSASEQASCTRTVEIGQFYVTNEFVWEGNRSTFLMRRILRTKEFSKFEITISS